ncbi:hypothetical protein [Methylosinus sp. Ce-a6]|uniref:hypothetical protein n=1 Tax=Methylosinus sp. Ce-a6 TaxID=2172005 RepID=UPI00135A3055|nr:hypothetical protein [Methylosinus sp. Ce-a6]
MSTIAARPSLTRFFQPFGLVVAAVLAGGATGFVLGSRTGVGEPIRAARPSGAQALAKALSWKRETADESEQRREIADLLDELRTARALIESSRHDEEGLRIASRLRALEAARDAGAARMERLESHLERLESQRIDFSPTGSAPSSASKSEPRRNGR